MREFDFIERIKNSKNFFFNPVIKGIGDDCAILPFSKTHDMIITADSFCEGVHFKRDYYTAGQIGAKSMAVNISDICAMGGVPAYAVVCIGFPGSCGQKYIDGIYGGIMDTAAGHSTDIIGGDTTASPSEIIISITLVGFVEKGRALRRDAAKAGDRVYVTGFLGDSHAGLMALSGKKRRGSGGYEYTAVEKHLAPCPRFNEGRLLLKSGLVDCCIDISDGIAGDLDRVCSQSGVGALIEADRLPVSYSAGKISADRNEDSIDYALYGGEDYELLFTVAEKNRKKFIGFAEKNCLNIFEAGIMTRRKGLYIKKGSRIYRENGKKIWKHF